MIEWYHWVIGGLIGLFLLITTLSIPSFIAMYKLGFKDYFRNIKLLYTLYNKMTICYRIKQDRVYNFRLPNGQHMKSQKITENDYYYPSYYDDNKVFVVNRKSEKGYFWNIRIHECNYDVNSKDWSTTLIEIKTISCMFTQILNDRFQKKLTNLTDNYVDLENIDNLNDLINGEITSIRREGKLNQILTNE